MKKNFSLKVEGKHPERLLEAVKHEIRSYLARERRKALPKDTDYWHFDCRFGATEGEAEVIGVGAITEHINASVAAEADAFYIEILARPAVRQTPVNVVSYDKAEPESE